MLFTLLSNIFYFSAAIQKKMRADESTVSRAGGYQLVVDHGDTYMTIAIEVGHQALTVIPDSGSFDLYLLSGTKCDEEVCEGAYDGEKSETHTAPKDELFKDIVFGSGAAKAKLGFDTVQIRDDSVSKKEGSREILTNTRATEVDDSQLSPLWEIVGMSDSLSAVWGDGKGFQGIVGIGFKGNTGKEEDEVVAEEEAAIEASLSSSSSSSLPGAGSEALFGPTFALCMPRGSEAQTAILLEEATVAHDRAMEQISSLKNAVDSDLSSSLLSLHESKEHTGRLWWGHKIPDLHFHSVPVTGTRHWAVELAHVSIKVVKGSEDKKLDSQVNMCQGHPCAALLDSGTSLLALPETRIAQIMQDSSISNLDPECSNADDMPDISLALGSDSQPVMLDLTPETYIMKVEADLEELQSLVESVKPAKGRGYPKLLLKLDAAIEKLQKRNEKLKEAFEAEKGNGTASSFLLQQRLQERQTFCTPAFMVSPIDHAAVGSAAKDHEVWILGIPIFREYIVKFDRAQSQIGFAEHSKDVCDGKNEPKLSNVEFRAQKTQFRNLPSLKDLKFPRMVSEYRMLPAKRDQKKMEYELLTDY